MPYMAFQIKTISHVEIVLNRVVFWSKGLFTPFLSTKKGYGSKGFYFCQQEKVMAQKCPRDIDNFLFD